MFLVINATGELWNGTEWSKQGKVFCSIGRAQRSLHENGEDLDKSEIVLSNSMGFNQP